MNVSPWPVSRYRGFTLTDMVCLLVVFLIGASLLSSGADLLRDKVEASRLQADIWSLNQEIYLYQASGGDLSGTLTPIEVIARIQASESSPFVHTVDSVAVGLRPIFQSRDEARSNAERAVWNPDTQTFEVSRDGPLGIKAFSLGQ